MSCGAQESARQQCETTPPLWLYHTTITTSLPPFQKWGSKMACTADNLASTNSDRVCHTNVLKMYSLSVFTGWPCCSSLIYHSEPSPVAPTILVRSWTMSDIAGLNSGSFCKMKFEISNMILKFIPWVWCRPSRWSSCGLVLCFMFLCNSFLF